MKRILFLFLSLISVGTFSQSFVTNNGISISNSARLVIVNGDWNSSGSLLLNGSVKTSGLFSHNGELSSASAGGFELTYSDSKLLDLGPNVSHLGYLSINGGGTVELNRDIVLKDSLVFKNGFIKMLNPTDTLQLSASAIIKSPGPTSYVKGVLARQGVGDKLFPIGNDTYYLPILFHNVQGASPKITVTLENAPAYTAGAAVSSTIGFPYAWRSYVENNTDTASYVELDYPDVLPDDSQLNIVRNTSGKTEFESMGQRAVTRTNGRIEITSYSKGLKGLFSLAAGYEGDVVTDSLALVALYNSTDGLSWTNRANWLTGNISSWHGVSQTGSRITALDLSNNNLKGSIPDELSDVSAMISANLENNAITHLPDLSQIPALTSLDVSGNNLDFGSLEPNAGISIIDYLNQAILGEPTSTQVDVGTNYTVTVNGGGVGDAYQWFFNDQILDGATDPDYEIVSIDKLKMGDYEADITNANLPGLTIRTAKQKVLAVADVTGKLLVSSDTPAGKGKMTLFRVTDQGQYDTLLTQPISADGTYLLENLVLDDYQLMGYADTITHVNALPTYYQKSIFWEEADVLTVEDNLANVDIISEFKPGPPQNGTGEITGILTEPSSGSGGRVKANKAIKNAGVTLRKIDKSGSSPSYSLVAYTFTNEKGEFTFNKLDPADYRLNIQYPGFPMDTNSAIDILVGSGPLDKQVAVDAEVNGGQIVVKKRIITGFDETTISYSVFPNPSRDRIRIKSKTGNTSALSIHLMEATGRNINVPKHFDKMEGAWSLDVSQLPFGSYFIQVEEKGRVEAVRVVITN